MRRQKAKGKRRPRSWHRGRTETALWARATSGWPVGDREVPPTGEPLPLRRAPGNRQVAREMGEGS